MPDSCEGASGAHASCRSRQEGSVQRWDIRRAQITWCPGNCRGSRPHARCDGAGGSGQRAAGSGQRAAAAYSCSAGYFCMYTGKDGGGLPCQFRDRTKDTAVACSWAASTNVKSVFNNSTFGNVTFYKTVNFNNRVGSTAPLSGGNLTGTYQIRSLTW
ncbi:peptidase inhibitor family I36 protein [Streptomyces sp. NPDC001520]|uniref:peptidase inhibitor family I36 protein n=1 Tax=Streptomyces sp. NPDC001520 TaxID=3364581 RepID=UPI00368C5974